MADTRQTHAIEYVKGDWDKAQYLPDPHVDNLTAVVMSLGTEFWAMRRRMMVIESLLEQNKMRIAAIVGRQGRPRNGPEGTL